MSKINEPNCCLNVWKCSSIGYHKHFLNKASHSLKDFLISFSSHHMTPHLRQSPEVYPRTSVHMLAPVRAAENRAGSLILLGFFFSSRPAVVHRCGNTTSHMQRYSEVVMSQCFMTFPWGHLYHCVIMSTYSSPGGLPGAQQRHKKDRHPVGSNYRHGVTPLSGISGFQMMSRKIEIISC